VPLARHSTKFFLFLKKHFAKCHRPDTW
jgi:hypothetical protein